jgi:hypothetical protein
VIEVEFVGRTALTTLTTVSLPNLQLDCCGYDPARLSVQTYGLSKVIIALDSNQLELEDSAMRVFLLPRIDKMEYAVVRPDTFTNLFIDSDSLRRARTRLEVLGGAMELSILRELAGWEALRLINSLGIRTGSGPGVIMPFVNKRRATVFYAISIRGVRSERHQNHGVSSAETEIHPTLQADTFTTAHFVV